MKLPIPDPAVLLARVKEFRGLVNALDTLAGPELKKLIAAHPELFGAVGELLDNGERFVKKLAAIKGALDALSSTINGRT